MKHVLLKSWLLMMCLLVGVGSAWAEDVVYKTAAFTKSSFSAGVQNYTSSFSSTTNNFQVDVANFNNNNNGWDFIKTGNKTNASVGTITTNAAIDKAITKVVVTIDAITASSVNSITLYSGTSASNCTTSEGTFSKSTGAQAVTISSPTANKFYKIAFDCKKGSSNGLVTVSKVDFYVDEGGTTTAVTGVSLDKTTLSLTTGGTATINATVTPSNATNKTVSWSSNRESVATVTDGVVTAVADGTATITATTEDGNYTATCEVTVSPYVQTYANTYTSGEGLLISNGTSTSQVKVKWNDEEYDAIKAGTSSNAGAIKITVPAGTKTLHLHIVGWNNEGKKVTVSGLAEDKDITINPDTGLAGTSSSFTLSEDPSTKHYYTIDTENSEDLELTFTATTGKRFAIFGVNAEAGTTKTATTLSWSAATASVEYGATNPTLPTLTTDPADLTGVTYKSSNTAVATINETTGAISIEAPGETKITASYAGNETYKAAQDASYTLTITKVLDRITLSGNYKTIFTEGEAFTHEGLVVTAVYNDKSDEDVTLGATFTTPDMTSVGNQTITVTYGSKTAEYAITINEAVKYTVTFDAQSGTCETVSLKETASSAGVTLPTATCLNSDWTFAGWATAACEETTTAPTLYKAGENYKPIADVTLYAVYMTGAEEGEIAFNRVTALSQIKNGDKVVVVHNSTNYAMTLSAGDNATVENANTISMSAVKKIWTVAITEDKYTFTDNQSSPKTLSTSGVPKTSTENIASVGAKGSSNNSYKYADWNISASSIENCWVLTNTYTTDNGSAALTVNSNPQWGVLNVNDQNGPRDASVFAMRIYVEGPTTSATYNSNPVATAIIDLKAEDGTDYYATFSNASAFIVPEDLTVSVVGVNGTKLIITNYQTGDVVAANTGVLVKGTQGGKHKVILTDEDATTAPGANNLRAATVEKEATGFKFYKLAYASSNRDNLGFYWGAANGGVFPTTAGLAYLAVPKPENDDAPQGFRLINDEATAIYSVTNEMVKTNAVYNIAGQRVSSKNFKGIVIVNGKKMLNK